MPMLGGTLVCNVMREVSAIPQHDILPENRLTVYPFADLGIGIVAGRHVKPVVDLVAMIPENPNIPGAERPVRLLGGDPVFGSRYDFISGARGDVLHPPFALVPWVAWPRNLKVLFMPVVTADDRWVVKLHDAIAAGSLDIEIETPVGMVVVHVAHARAFGSGETEARSDSAVGGEPPLAYIAIPAGFHFAHQYDLLALHVDADAQKVTDVGAGIHDRLCRS